MEKKVSENDMKKEYLKGYEKEVREEQREEEKIRELRYCRIGGGKILDHMPHSSHKDDLSGYAALIDEEERKHKKARYKRIKKCKEITDKIERMENEDEKDILMYRYIKRMKWEEICTKMNREWAQIHRIHARALKNFQISE